MYHFDKGHLQSMLNSNHPIFSQRIFTNLNLFSKLKSKIIFVYAYCNDTQISAEGVPGIIVISREIREFKKKYDATCCMYNDRIDKLE